MISNLEHYRKDLDSLLASGNALTPSLNHYCFKQDFEEVVKQQFGEKSGAYLASLPPFQKAYQPWYSEAKALIKQLLPDRLDDFIRHYEKPKSRKEITYESYRIEDCLLGISVTRGRQGQTVVTLDGA